MSDIIKLYGKDIDISNLKLSDITNAFVDNIWTEQELEKMCQTHRSQQNTFVYFESDELYHAMFEILETMNVDIQHIKNKLIAKLAPHIYLNDCDYSIQDVTVPAYSDGESCLTATIVRYVVKVDTVNDVRGQIKSKLKQAIKRRDQKQREIKEDLETLNRLQQKYGAQLDTLLQKEQSDEGYPYS